MKTARDLLGDLDVKAWKRGWELVNAVTEREARRLTPEERLRELDELSLFGLPLRQPEPLGDSEVREVRERWVALRKALVDRT